MDLNYYLQREQVERIRADAAPSRTVRKAHQGLADLYRERIDAYRESNGAMIIRPTLS